MTKGKMGGGDVIAIIDPEEWDTNPQVAYANGWNAAIDMKNAEAEKLRDSLENLIIAIGTGWNLDGVVDAAKSTLGHTS